MKLFTEVGYKRAVRLVGSFSSSQSLCTFVRSERWVPSVCSTRAWEVPGHSQLSHICSSLSAKHTGRGHAQRRGLIGSAAGSSSQPVQIIIIIITKEWSRRGTSLHALEIKPEGNLSVLTASQYLVIATQFWL